MTRGSKGNDLSKVEKEHRMKIAVCGKHPKYKGVRPPKVDCTQCRRLYASAHWEDGVEAIASALKVELRTVKGYARTLGLKIPVVEATRPKVVPADERAQFDLKERKLKIDKRDTVKKYRILQDELHRLQTEREALLALSTPASSFRIKPASNKSTGGESTCFAIASDWHIEERVSPGAVNGMNEYSLSIARERAEKFFQVALRLRNIESKNTPVPTMVLGLLGDFITGHIHEENLAVCALPPVEAAIEAKKLIKSGIDFLLKNSDLNIVAVCHSGNHARITQKYRSSETEQGNSLEFFVYGFLAQEYKDEPRVQFHVSQGYTSRLQVYDTVLRFHHGHRIRYQGGVGGLTIPANKYIARSNTAWAADFDVFGHHHRRFFGGNFICNGSMIGYNAYAQDSGFEFEAPSQTFFTINKKWPEIIDYRPILFT